MKVKKGKVKIANKVKAYTKEVDGTVVRMDNSLVKGPCSLTGRKIIFCTTARLSFHQRMSINCDFRFILLSIPITLLPL